MRALAQKTLYGCAEAGSNAVETFIRLHLLVFYSKIMGLPTSWVGIALAIAILWDAAIDPWMGRVSDEFKAQKGTRIHLMLIGVICTGLTLWALYHPPALSQPLHLWFYLLGASLFLNTSLTLFTIPYLAMAGDYTADRNARAGFIAWRFVFSNVGAILGIAIPGHFLSIGASDAYSQATWLLVLFVLFAGFLCSLAPPPLRKEPPQEAKLGPARHPLWEAFHNKAFLWVVLASIVVNIGLTINTSVALYYYRMRLQLSEKEIQNVLLLFFLVFSLSVPLWIWISRLWGRKRSLMIGAFLIGTTNLVIYQWLPPGNAMMAYIWASGLGGLLVGSAVILESVLTDVVDYDHWKHGRERLGLYFGIWKFSSKFSRAFSLLLVGLLLDWANVAFPDVDTTSRLAWIFSLGVGAFFLLAMVFLIPYPLTEQQCAEIKKKLEDQSGPGSAFI